MSDFKKDFSIVTENNRQRNSRDREENAFDFSTSKHAYPPKRINDESASYTWTAVSKPEVRLPEGSVPLKDSEAPKTAMPVSYKAKAAIDDKMFVIPDAVKSEKGLEMAGQTLIGAVYHKQDLSHANFSAANLTQADFSGAVLKGVDFSGADLTDANLSGADLTDAVLSGSNLLRANFTGAKLNHVILTEANLEEAIMLGIEIDDLAVEELQALVEYMAVYYPHKLNLTKLNLTLLDLSKIDLTNVSLRGVDFTGCSMKGVKIWELDLSECIISPAQIAEAIGHVPSPQELAQLLAPKVKKKKKEGIDMSDLFFDNGKEFGVWDVTREKGLDIGKLVESGMKLFRKSAAKPQPPIEGEEIVAHIKEEKLRNDSDKARNEELKERIRQRKEEELQKLAAMKNEFKKEVSRDGVEHEVKETEHKKIKDQIMVDRLVIRDRGRE